MIGTSAPAAVRDGRLAGVWGLRGAEVGVAEAGESEEARAPVLVLPVVLKATCSRQAGQLPTADALG